MASRRLLLSPVVVFVAACAVSAGTFAAYTATSTNPDNLVEAGSVHLYDNDSGSSLVGLSGAGAGASDTSCIRVTSDGTLASQVRLRADSAGSLARHLGVRITRGSGASSFDDCAGFTPDERNYYGLGNGVVYDGRLSDMPSDWATGISDPSATLHATTILPILTSRANLVGLWELGERTRRADDFAGVPNALLTSRGELVAGTAWARQAVSTTNLVFSASGRVRPQNAGTAIYRITGTNAAAEVVTADFTVRSTTGEAGLMSRMPTTGDTGYLVRYRAAAGVWELGTINAGAFTVLSSWTSTVAVGATAHVVLDQNGPSIRVLIDGEERLTATDASIASTGRTGVRLVGTGGQDDNAGVHVDNFRTYQPNQGSTVAATGTAGTATGGPVVTNGAQPSPTDIQWGVAFNGTTQTLALPAAGLTTAATIGGWFKLSGGSAIMRDSSTGANAGWSLGFDDGSGTMKFRVSDQVFDTGIPFAPLRNDWHHHALVRNGGAVQYFLDGRKVFEGSVGATTAPTSPFFLMRDGTGTAYSSGRVDQVGIWSRALGPAEIAGIHDAVSAPSEWEQGESNWYRVTVTVDEDPAAASSSATNTFSWEAHSR
ncbi:MAG: LamG domain-containing protein [Solirubrobacteraceae bacterium]|nr:LamG domain-containing protein [Solirubrobacteraceae bacterium]